MRWPPPPDWPMAEVSRRVVSGPHRWHVQEAGTGPTILLLHGSGGATQSWRGVFPLLAADFHVIAIDMPGQGFTAGARDRSGVADTATDLAALCAQEGWTPDLLVGHSAGAPIALQLVLNGMRPARGVLGINAALQTFDGVAGWLFPVLAKALAAAPFTAPLFAATTTEGRVRRLLDGTGSQIGPEGQRLYLALASDTDHVSGTLAQMAQWNLESLSQALPQVDVPVLLLIGDNDPAVPPSVSLRASARMSQAETRSLGPLGHLAHEEDPAAIARIIRVMFQ
ncbi:magnesium chelatase [Loktanella sp. 3ANDIMAR09]|uniref:alpha/beta fold hydrolase BchO n=1 Tax=Loktanella sp. 3ANDIMAR09 TaxID=1225657 RepID=UPI0006F92965|nr:alpha/beta fold hydrolase BchO [Loktanella sp. 3ANDIMAR09]KQI70241.1 magnesium chelatase [Loktanella sp. 3ANDIMAR09]